MKRNLKQILLVFLALALTVSASTCLFSCGKGDKTTTGSTIPGIQSSEGSTSGTVDAAGGTTGAVVNGTTGTGTVTPPEGGNYINPLTGLKGENKNLRPLAVVVDNVDAALANQTGVAQADIVYETLVGPGITRFTALISDYSTLKDICNIREAYTEHIGIVGSHNALLVAHGGAAHLSNFNTNAVSCFGGGHNTELGKETYGYINTMKDVAFTSEGGTKYGTIKENSVRKDIPHDTLLTKSAVEAVFSSAYSLFKKSGATETGTAQGFKFAEGTKTMDGAAANEVKIVFTFENAQSTKNVSYVYNAQSGKYQRFQGTAGTAHKDAVSGEQLAFTNVITLFTDVTSQTLSDSTVVTATAVEGEGTGYYFYGGKAVEIKWSKSAWNGALTLTDNAGNALELACGTTYISYLDNTDTAKAVTFN